ncbi:MAG: hypothetical protein JWM68_1506 [Verrucomicrobiales bacterium]|nr:hypothetical protein [Verrucomicrobiales bacterium]
MSKPALLERTRPDLIAVMGRFASDSTHFDSRNGVSGGCRHLFDSRILLIRLRTSKFGYGEHAARPEKL